MQRPLVVLDNVPRPGPGGNPADKLLVRAAGVATLLTTRFQQAVPMGVAIREIDALTQDDARALLCSHIGAALNEDMAATQTVLAVTGRLPLFLNVVGYAVRNRWYTLAEYARELSRRGLAALEETAGEADEADIRRAAVVIDLSWQHLSTLAQEVFAILALAPGEDIGPNLVDAWLRQGETVKESRKLSGRLLGELANASLLIPTDERARRYRYHDRVRDYALGKLAQSGEEVRLRLIGCYADWNMVKGEYDAVGAFALARQYHRLRSWGVAEPKGFPPWYHFVRGQASVLTLQPKLFFQQALNEPVDSPVSRAAQERSGTEEAPRQWLVWVNRPQDFVAPVCLQVLRWDAYAISSVAMSADGRSSVSGSELGSVNVWDSAIGECRGTLSACLYPTKIVSLALSEDRLTAISVANDNKVRVRVWDLRTQRRRGTLKGHRCRVSSVAMSADARVAISGAHDCTVRVWDLDSMRCRGTLGGHTLEVSSVAMSADGRVAISGAHDCTLRVWDLDSMRCRGTLEGHTLEVSSVAMSADGRVAISGAHDCTVRVWDLTAKHCRAAIEKHKGGVNSVGCWADGRTAVSVANDRTVRVWDLQSGRCSAVHLIGTPEARCICNSIQGSVSLNARVTMHFLEVFKSGPSLRNDASVIAQFPGNFTRAACSRDGRHIVAGDGQGQVYILRLCSRVLP